MRNMMNVGTCSACGATNVERSKDLCFKCDIKATVAHEERSRLFDPKVVQMVQAAPSLLDNPNEALKYMHEFVDSHRRSQNETGISTIVPKPIKLPICHHCGKNCTEEEMFEYGRCSKCYHCRRCGKRPLAYGNKSRCVICRDKENAAKKLKTQENKKSNMCADCKKVPALKTGGLCGDCNYELAKELAKFQKKRFYLRKEAYIEKITQNCFYCELPSDVLKGIGLDRIDNTERSYTNDNTVSCCSWCNMTRGDRYTSAQFKQYFAKGVRAFRLASDPYLKQLKKPVELLSDTSRIEFIQTYNILEEGKK